MAITRRRGKVRQVRLRNRGFAPVSASFDTRAQAERWAAQVERRMAEGRSPDREGVTMRALAVHSDAACPCCSLPDEQPAKARQLDAFGEGQRLAGEALWAKRCHSARWLSVRMSVIRSR